MNILFVSHCDFTGNSAMHIFSIANELVEYGNDSVVCVPNDPKTVFQHAEPKFQVLGYSEASGLNIAFPDGRGPDFIHAWTPRELVRKLTIQLVARYGCPYLVHLEDNEEAIVKNELGCDDLNSIDSDRLDSVISECRSHPVRYKKFLSDAAGVTVLMDTLLEFKPDHVPGVVFWPGFDKTFCNQQSDKESLRRRLGLSTEDIVLTYNGNIHASNRKEVCSLFLAVGLLSQMGYDVKIIKTGWNHVEHLGSQFEPIKSLIIDLGFVPRLEIPSLLSLADVLVQPGTSDIFNDYRFPSKLPEYFVTGIPVLLPRANIGRFIVDGVEGILLEEGNALEIAKKVELLLCDRELYHRVGKGGHLFAMRELQWSKNVKKLHDFYQSISNKSHDKPVFPLSLKDEAPDSRNAQAPQPFSSSSCTSEAGKNDESKIKMPRLIAFYLPQFHPIKENDEWWGKGFTEWTNVVRARPYFRGHHQPHLPTDLGFYDLRLPEVMEEQVKLARSYGIGGFCFYYYWFNGRRLLERPLDNMLASGMPDFPFCICWANENWSRRWDGSEDDILMKQEHSPESDARFIRDIIPMLRDPRYIKVQGKPIILVYRVNLLPDPASTAHIWRTICAEEGIPSIHLCAVQSFGITNPRPYGFDAAVEFPPHTKRALIDPGRMPDLDPSFEGYIEDYLQVARHQVSLPPAHYLKYRGIMPSWDNTARRRNRGHVIINSSPSAYEAWLQVLIQEALEDRSPEDSLIFINAWNEWGEGNHLEPDQKNGHAYLEATRRALDLAERRFASQHSSATWRQIIKCLSSVEGEYVGPIPSGTNEVVATPTVEDSVKRTAKTRSWFNDAALRNIVERYQGKFAVKPLSYATVREFCDSVDHLGALASANGDLKDCQRPWMLKAILGSVPRGSRVLEIGAGEPFVADILSRLGYEVFIVDPYDGSGNGPQEYEKFSKECPNITFMRAQFTDKLAHLQEHSFDCIFSISVLEHIPEDGLRGLFKGLKKFLKPEGVSIHAVDHVHKGNGEIEHLKNLEFMATNFGLSAHELHNLLDTMTNDTETYYLSAESHNRWRGGVPYDEFPMRICVSIEIVAEARRIHSCGV